jgi:DNA-directed RNA polymerase I, II, and III subunit RPABC5
MIIPVRCYTCGKVVGNKWDRYQSLLREGKTIEEACNILKLERYCCKRMLMTHVNLIDKLLEYKQLPRNFVSYDTIE